MRLSRSSSVLIALLFCGGCEEEQRQPAVASKPASSPNKDVETIPTPVASTEPRPPLRAFLDEKKEIQAGVEWNREVVSRNGGAISFRVDSQGLFAVTLVTGQGYKAAMADSKAPLNRSDLLLTADSQGTTYEGKVTIPAGSSYFIIENRAKKAVEFHLQCFPGQQ
jgi:hypothetical protein